MNISLSQYTRVLCISFLLMFLALDSIQGQGAVEIEIYEGDTYTYSFYTPFQAFITGYPQNGTAKINGLWGNLAITYTPNEGFLGKDKVKFQYWASWSSGLSLRYLDITVKPHEIFGEDDYAITQFNEGIQIDVKANDSATRGDFSISEISIVNNGSATIVDDQIHFVPDEDFEGTGYVTYVICDSMDLCTSATLTVTVLNTSEEDTRTINIKTAENTDLPLFLPNESFTTFVEPNSGVITHLGGNEFIYRPDPDYVGEDVAILTGKVGDYDLTYIYYIEVIDKPDDNIFAKDDHFITRINEPVTFNVLHNDSNGDLTIQYTTHPGNGNLVDLGDGNYRFEPSFGFSGITTFTYTLGDEEITNYESATVIIIVGNFNPASETFLLTTPKNTARVLNYDVPITDFEFTVKEQPVHGSMDFYPGMNYLTIQGQAVSGNNLLIYTPDTDFVGIDEFVLEYCVNGSCIEFTILMDVIEVGTGESQFCVDDCVWPGDANDDGIVDMSDLLTVGFAIGKSGQARSSSTMIWYGQFAEDWGSLQKNLNKDLKFADSNGDGFITAKDTTAISEFYGLTHDLIPERYSSVKEVPIFFNILTAGNTPGSEVRIEVVAGSKANPAIDVYGLVFSIPYSSSRVKDGVLKLDFDAESWMTYGTPVLNMTKTPYIGQLDAGFSRTNGISSTGWGRIGEIGFVVSDEITGIRRDPGEGVKLQLDHLYGVTSTGEYVRFVA
ncbi:MAG: cadherin-like domain-containing protein, partial [Bacteroidia bacterium]|nr:cadherin-like domain-containing protein [Bacteroidia bacterium]